METIQPDVKPVSEQLPSDKVDHPDQSEAMTKVTTVPRKPMHIPDSVHVRVTQENLRDYVGP